MSAAPAPAALAAAAVRPGPRERWAPYLLSGPALLLFAGALLIPLVMTVLLSFYEWGQYKGIVARSR